MNKTVKAFLYTWVPLEEIRECTFWSKNNYYRLV